MYLFSTVTYSRHVESLTSEINTKTHFRAETLLEYESREVSTQHFGIFKSKS